MVDKTKDGMPIHPSDPAALIDLIIQTAAAYRGQTVFGEDQVIAMLRHHMGIPFPSETRLPITSPPAEPVPAVRRALSAMALEQTIFSDGIVCLECGQKFLTLKRHLRHKHNLTPLEYLDRHKLPPDYPMVAADYKDKRRVLIKEQIEKYGPTRTKKPPKIEPPTKQTKPRRASKP